MAVDRRIYTRYEINVEAKAGLTSGMILSAEALDISAEGVRLRFDGTPQFEIDDELYIVIKGEKTLKIKGKIKWIKQEKNNTEIGVKFEHLDMETSQLLSKILSDMALSYLEDKYLK